MRFIFGLTVGIALGSAGTALAAQLVGNPGFLIGWEVTKDGETICSDPHAWPGIQEIECD